MLWAKSLFILINTIFVVSPHVCLTIHSVPKPVDDATKIDQFTGVIINGATGLVGFTPDGLTDIGKYFYDCQAIDGNTERNTFLEGKYEVQQDRTKD